MKKHVMITSADAKHGDFLVDHWLRSLKDQVDLRDIDVIVIDYGLTNHQRALLKKNRVRVVTKKKNGHVVTQRFTDAGDILKDTSYDQVLSIDGADIIFQGDISHLLNEHTDRFRVAKLEMEVMFFEAFIPNNFSPMVGKSIWRVLKDKPTLNAGVLLAPRDKFLYLCSQMDTLIRNKQAYGPDQIVVNYVLHQDKIALLDRLYNFMPHTEKEGIVIHDGVVYLTSGEKIIVVHNAGHNNISRPIKNFGYGVGYNKLKHGLYYTKKSFSGLLGLIKSLYMPLAASSK